MDRVTTSPDLAAVQRRTLRVVVASQVCGGAGLAAGVSVGGLLAQDMLGGDAVAGLPAALFTLGSALAAFSIGRVTQRSGRRIGLAGGFLTGAVGAVGIVLAAAIDNPVLLFASMFVYGAGTATNLQARYAATDLAPAERRATAVSTALVATTFGAVAGPNLIEPLGRLARSLGLPALAGPFLLAAVAFGLAGVVLLIWLRPDPLLVAREHLHPPAAAASAEGPTRRTAFSNPPLLVGTLVMVLTQIAMVAIMTMTPVHMRAHHHHLGDVGLVISLHIAAMFLPSLVTGRLVDRVGRPAMASAAGLTLLAAGLVAALAPGDSMPWLIVALVLLGLGWNFGLISGTALLIDATEPATRAKTQGSVDVLIALAGAGGGAMSGVVASSTSFATLSLAGGLLSVLLVPAVLFLRSTAPRP